jgi:RNA polymerase primary sigma factor
MRTGSYLIATINKVVRTERVMFSETGCASTAERLGERLALSPDQVHRMLEIARRPLQLRPTGR